MKFELVKYAGFMSIDNNDESYIKVIESDPKKIDFLKDQILQFVVCGFNIKEPVLLSQLERNLMFLVQEELVGKRQLKISVMRKEAFTSDMQIEDLNRNFKFEELKKKGLSILSEGKVTLEFNR